MKVVINAAYSGFALSELAYERLIQLGILLAPGNDWDSWIRENRSHPLLIKAVEDLGVAANGRFAQLKIVEIPDDVEFEISQYNGLEHIAEKHRTWD